MKCIYTIGGDGEDDYVRFVPFPTLPVSRTVTERKEKRGAATVE